MRRILIFVLITLFGCNGVPGPQPPEKKCPPSCPLGTICIDPAKGCQPIPPPGPVCENGVDQCGCFVMPPETGEWEELLCSPGQTCDADRQCVSAPPPACPPSCPVGYSCADPAVGCVKDATPPPTGEPCSINGEPGPEIPGYRPVLGGEVNAAMAARTGCSPGSRCVVQAGRQAWQAEVVTEMIRRGRCAGQHAPTTDEIAVATSVTAPREGWHIYAGPDGGPGTVVWSPGAARPAYSAPNGPPVEPPPAQGACSAPWPPKVAKWGGPKPHNKTNDSTPLFYNGSATRWDGSEVTGFCDLTGWNGSRLFCPARMECKGTEEPPPQNFKCEERAPCEEIGVAGSYGGKPLWRSDGKVELSGNPFQATCSDCTWLEVCAADGWSCSRCAISPATGLCEVTP
jgi:hypothetical protein